MFLYACIQDLVKTQVFTSGNISEANQNVVSKVQQVRYWIPYSCIMCPYIALICGFALGFALSKTTNSCSIRANNALLCIQYPIQNARKQIQHDLFLHAPVVITSFSDYIIDNEYEI